MILNDKNYADASAALEHFAKNPFGRQFTFSTTEFVLQWDLDSEQVSISASDTQENYPSLAAFTEAYQPTKA
jgi:hypothetical protein